MPLTSDSLPRHHIHGQGADQEQVRGERVPPRPRGHPPRADQAACRDQGQGGHRGEAGGHPGHDHRRPRDPGDAGPGHPPHQLLLQTEAAGEQRRQSERHLGQASRDKSGSQAGQGDGGVLLLHAGLQTVHNNFQLQCVCSLNKQRRLRTGDRNIITKLGSNYMSLSVDLTPCLLKVVDKPGGNVLNTLRRQNPFHSSNLQVMF